MPMGANAQRESLLIVPTWAGDSEITSPCEDFTSCSFLHDLSEEKNLRREKNSFSFRDITAPRFRGIRCEEKFFPHLSYHHRETSTILSPASYHSTHTYFL
jgi:hypothetical protein